ncbi:bacterioferritin-associated ferredoxin [Neorhizobium phenanthreniclasticum]
MEWPASLRNNADTRFFLDIGCPLSQKEDVTGHVSQVDREMLVCSCNYITDREIRDVIIELLNEDCWQLIVPAKVYHAMDKRGRCCGCFPNVVDLIIRTTEEYHAEHHSTEAEVVVYMSRLKQFHEENRRADIERRLKGHRAA